MQIYWLPKDKKKQLAETLFNYYKNNPKIHIKIYETDRINKRLHRDKMGRLKLHRLHAHVSPPYIIVNDYYVNSISTVDVIDCIATIPVIKLNFTLGEFDETQIFINNPADPRKFDGIFRVIGLDVDGKGAELANALNELKLTQELSQNEPHHEFHFFNNMPNHPNEEANDITIGDLPVSNQKEIATKLLDFLLQHQNTDISIGSQSWVDGKMEMTEDNWQVHLEYIANIPERNTFTLYPLRRPIKVGRHQLTLSIVLTHIQDISISEFYFKVGYGYVYGFRCLIQREGLSLNLVCKKNDSSEIANQLLMLTNDLNVLMGISVVHPETEHAKLCTLETAAVSGF